MTDVKNSWLVLLNDGQDVNKAADDIKALAKVENEKVTIGSKMKILGILQMSCKADFAAAVGKMPSVKAVEAERLVSKPKPVRKHPKSGPK